MEGHKLSVWPGWVLRLKIILGVDRAIAYTVLAKGCNILGSAGTVLLIVHFLSPIEQGYYYTLLSLVSLRLIFELGFSFVILQMAAHEAVHVRIHPDGHIDGDPVAHARLASIFQKAVRWYQAAAVILWIVLLPVGILFFSHHARSTVPVAWHGAWLVAVSATTMLFLVDPIFSFLEGCGQVWEIAAVRCAQAMLGACMSWAALVAHRGLYSPGMVNIGYSLVALAYLWRQRELWLGLLRHPVGPQSVSWRREIWPFQWKIAVSWICSYCTAQAFVPLLFAMRGPIEAGQMGMSLSVTGYLSILAFAWTSTKAAPFGQMVARGDFERLDVTFFCTLRQSLSLLALIGCCCFVVVAALPHADPKLSARIVSPSIFFLLILTMISSFTVQSLATYLRSFKREPFLWQYVFVAAFTLGLALLTSRRWGAAGAAVSYALCTGVIGLLLSVYIFQRYRRDHVLSRPVLLQPEVAQ